MDAGPAGYGANLPGTPLPSVRIAAMNDLYAVFANTIRTITVFAVPLLLGFAWHVAAQCYAAQRLGDRTAQQLGRLSMNPTKHIDPIGTIVIPVICFIASGLSGVPLLFGYAKPLPIDFGNLRHPKRDMLWIALAGIAANLVMAAVWLLIRLLFIRMNVQEIFFIAVAEAGTKANLLLIGVYLIPLLPFDGGRIVFSLLPHKNAFEFAKIEPYTMFIVMLLLIPGLLQRFWIQPIAQLFAALLNLILSPLNFLLS